MKTNVVVQSAALAPTGENRVLREGSSVFVRVLKNNGNGSYTVSFAGGKFSIRSELSLEVGKTFSAKVMLDGTKVVLKPEQLKNASSIAVRTVQGESLSANAEFLRQLGLVPDGVSLALLNQMRLLGTKFDHAQFLRARRFLGKDEQHSLDSAVTSYIFEKKGFLANDAAVQAVLERGEDAGGGSKSKSDSQKNSPENAANKKSALLTNVKASCDKVFTEVFKSFFENLFNIEETKNTAQNSVLSLFNHTGFRPGAAFCNGSWITVPFDFFYKKEGAELACSGVGRFSSFINSASKKMSEATLSFKFEKSEYFLALFFGATKENSTELSRIKVALRGEENSSALENFIFLLKTAFPETDISLINDEEWNAFYAEPAEFLTVEGSV